MKKKKKKEEEEEEEDRNVRFQRQMMRLICKAEARGV